METLQTWITTWLDPRTVGTAVMDWGGRVAGALLIFIVGRLLMRALTNWATAALRRVGMDDTLSRFLGNSLYIALLTLLALTAFEALGVETLNFVAILGAAGLAVGLALKDSLSNFSSGVMLVFFRPFKVGDQIDAAAQTTDYAEVRSDLLERIKRSLDKYGLSIPAEHRAVPPPQLIASK